MSRSAFSKRTTTYPWRSYPRISPSPHKWKVFFHKPLVWESPVCSKGVLEKLTWLAGKSTMNESMHFFCKNADVPMSCWFLFGVFPTGFVVWCVGWPFFVSGKRITPPRRKQHIVNYDGDLSSGCVLRCFFEKYSLLMFTSRRCSCFFCW